MPSNRDRLPWWVRLQRAPGRLLHWLTELGAKLVSPIEWFVSTVVSRVFGLFERAEGLESLIVRLGAALLWPFRIVWNGIARLAGAILPDSVRHVLAAPFRGLTNLSRWMVQFFLELVEKLNLDGPLLKLARWTRPLWYPFAAVGGFLAAWAGTRQLKQLLWALPTLLVLLPILLAMTWTKVWGTEGVATRYKAAVAAAMDKQEYELVRLYERKLAQLGVNTQLTDFNTAVALERGDKFGEALERMKLLAPENAPGYPQAHFWIIQQLLSHKLEVSEEENHRLLGIHLKHLRTLGVRGPEIQPLEAFWLAQEGKLQEAINLIKPLVVHSPEAAIMSMEFNLQLQNFAEAAEAARAIRVHFSDKARKGIATSARQLQSWAIAEGLLGDTVAQQAVVRQWLDTDPENKTAKEILADLCQRQFKQSIRVPNPDIERLANMFVEAAQLTQNPQRLQNDVVNLYRLRPVVPAANSILKEIVGSPKTTSPILEAIGTAAAGEGEVNEAKTYLKLAIDKDPQNSIAWNNYAWVLLQGSGSNLSEALEAVNKALAIKPDDFRFRETRGQILVRQKKWREAIPDLEYAVNGMPDSTEIHQSLASAYEATGQNQLAQVHRQQSQ